jgi:hypothetical protein
VLPAKEWLNPGVTATTHATSACVQAASDTVRAGELLRQRWFSSGPGDALEAVARVPVACGVTLFELTVMTQLCTQDTPIGAGLSTSSAGQRDRCDAIVNTERAGACSAGQHDGQPYEQFSTFQPEQSCTTCQSASVLLSYLGWSN